jgi:ABC-type nitrate/sulfonate/bicarbonate transport system substrate-binding protein
MAAAILISPTIAQAQQKAAGKLVEVKVGFNSAIDQIAVPVGVEEGFFDKNGLDVTLAPAFASGVDALNALQAGDVQFVHVGVPLMGAMIAGMDVVYVGSYTGTGARIRSDGTFSIVAGKDSGINAKDFASFRGKKIASTLGSTNHIYVRNLLASKGIKPEEYTLVNTAPPDMPVALSGRGVDAVACWDPWPIISRINAPGAFEVTRGGGFVANVGYIVAMREFAEKNPEIVEKFLTARAESDQWVRKNPKGAAEIATRWIPGTSKEVAEEAMQFVGPLTDGRMSACTVRGMQEGMDATRVMRNLSQPVDVRKFVRGAAATKLMQTRPDLFADLEAIPAAAKLPGDDLSKWDMTIADTACLK